MPALEALIFILCLLCNAIALDVAKESATEITGPVQVTIADDFKKGRSETIYHIRDRKMEEPSS